MFNHIFNAWSQLCNALIGGHSNESISGRAYREQWAIRYIINLIFFWQNNHCRGAYNADRDWAMEYLRGRHE